MALRDVCPSALSIVQRWHGGHDIHRVQECGGGGGPLHLLLSLVWMSVPTLIYRAVVLSRRVQLVGCNVFLRHGATNDTHSNVHMDPPHSRQYNALFAFEVQAVLCHAIRGDLCTRSHLTLTPKRHNCHLTIKNITIAGSCAGGLGTVWHHFQGAAVPASQ